MKNINNIRHTLSHVMTFAIQELYGQTIGLGVGPVIENGWYQDFDLETASDSKTSISIEDFNAIEKKMKELINKDLELQHKTVSKEEAVKLAGKDKYKLSILEDLVKDGTSEFSFYAFVDTRNNEKFKDSKFINLCSGPHIENTKELKNIGWKLDRVSGAYWRGDENNKMLQRVYGVAFETKEELEDYTKKINEAKKRDHRKLGKELDLFTIDQNVGLGLPLWKPKGAFIVNKVKRWFEDEQLKRAYVPVITPHIGRKSLWEMSGHWGFYNDSMYPPL